MPLYECVYIARQDVSSGQVEQLSEQFTNILAQGEGEVKKTEYWGLKSIAFRIKKNRKGHYVLLNIDAPPAVVTEMERQMRLNEDILRFLTIRVDEHEEGPSAMMQAKGREREGDRRRGDRGDRPDRGDRDRGDRDRGDRGDRPDRGDRGDRPRRDRERPEAQTETVSETSAQ